MEWLHEQSWIDRGKIECRSECPKGPNNSLVATLPSLGNHSQDWPIANSGRYFRCGFAHPDDPSPVIRIYQPPVALVLPAE